jgi:hypothetical protein
MLIALADENAGAEASLREQIDTVSTAQKFLKAHSASCKRGFPTVGKASGNEGVKLLHKQPRSMNTAV